MSAFTLAYLARLELWGLAAAMGQGCLVFLSWRAWARVTSNASPAARHRLACAHFAALAVLPVATLAILHATMNGATAASTLAAPTSAPPGGSRLVSVLALLVGGLWLTGAVAMALRLCADVCRIMRLYWEPAPTALVEAVNRLAWDRIGCAGPTVRTADIATPQIVGVWRPVLLAPRDLTLADAERDAVLLHELAHVKRRDFGWNLVQRLVLTVLWFHPAAWALYGAVGREREMCCDSLAVRHGASASRLARALIMLAERHGAAGLAMGIANRADLGARVDRLLEPPRASRLSRRFSAQAALFSILCLTALAAGRLGSADPAMHDLYAASAFGPTVFIRAHDPAGSFALRIRHGRVIEASVAEHRLPEGGILQHGDRVTLVGGARTSFLALTVTPEGRVWWKART